MSVNLDRIERLAKLARNGNTEAPTWRVREFREAVCPDTVLELVAELRQARRSLIDVVARVNLLAEFYAPAEANATAVPLVEAE